MDDKERKNISETFGKYTDSSAFGPSGGYNNIREPKNVSSSMWAPISGGTNVHQRRSDAPQESRNISSNTAQPRANAPISEGRQPAAKPKQNNSSKNVNTGKASGKSTKQKKKAPEKSRTPKGKPVSERNSGGKKVQNGSTPSRKRAGEKNQQQAKAIRRQEQLKKNRKDYEAQIKDGKSHNEISRKRAADKSRKRRIRSIISVVVFLIFVCAFVGVYSYSKGAPIANIIIEGESVYKNEEIIESAGLEIGLNMLSLREKAINEQVTLELPYIHSVELSRKLPDTVTLTVTPTKEKYLIVNDTGYICVDEHEKILSVKKKKLKDGSFRVNGFEYQEAEAGTSYEPSQNNKEKFELVKKIIKAIEAKGTIKKAVINVADMSDVKITYNSKVMIYLGDCKNLENQINLACDVLTEAASQGQTGYIDTRYEGRAYFNEGTMKID
ncbi:MAG: FtsQ-type POTRA domain-containing protein [Clostridia bacterium]|nr:FtsQ-type POTRA domain-containing protein [Clostridia bacterium]